jgi:hypothetical protein
MGPNPRPDGTKRKLCMSVMRNLPVVPICRRRAALAKDPNRKHDPRVPASSKRGVSRSSRNVGRDAMDAARQLTSDVVRGRRSRVVLMPQGWHQALRIGDVGPIGPDAFSVQATETTKSGLRGEYEESRKPACRECRCFGCTCGDLSLCALPNRTQGCGSSKRPAFPAPSLARDDDFD